VLSSTSLSITAKALDVSPLKRALEFRYAINPGRKTPGSNNPRGSRVNAAKEQMVSALEPHVRFNGVESPFASANLLKNVRVM
jgi:hypothetical protein